MNIFMKKKSCLVKKIKQTDNGWNLYPVDEEEKPIFISRENYSGNMPPFFKWPWQRVNLEVLQVGDFQVSVSINDINLFEIPENNYPEKIQKRLSYGEKLEKDYEAFQKKTDEAIVKALNSYLQIWSRNPNLESQISELKICFRPYLQLHLFKGPSASEYVQKVNLMAKLCEIAQRIYYRHFDEKSLLGTTSAYLKYGIQLFNEVFPPYELRVEEIEQAVNDKSKTDVTLADYYEADRLLTEVLPPIEDELLKRYLNYTVRDILRYYARDLEKLSNHYLTDAWGNRTCTNEREYQRQFESMELLKYHSLILPEQFSDQIIKNFIDSYTLK